MKWIIIALSGFGGLAILIAGIVVGLDRYKIFRMGIHTQGKVVEQIREVTAMDPLSSGRRSTHYAAPVTVITYTPVIEFQIESGENVRFHSTVSSQDPGNMPVGAVVDVVYDSSDPSNAQTVTLYQLLLTPLVMIVLGLVLALGAARSIFVDD